MVSIRIKRFLSLLGCILLHFSYGHMYTIGNMGTYITAYMNWKGLNVSKSDMIILTSVIISFEAIAMPIGGLLRMKIPLHWVLSMSCLIHSGAIAVTYFTVKLSFWWLLLTYGALQGFGFGFGYSVVISVAVEWFETHRALIVGIVVAAFALGSMVFSPIQTAYINPFNQKVDSINRTWDDPDLLMRIPSSFLVLAAVLFGLELIGISIIRERVNENEISTQQIEIEARTNPEPGTLTNTTTDMSPLQAIKTLDFYLLWTCVCLVIIPLNLMATLTKFFGLQYINDDQFVVGVTMFGSICNAVGRIIWGFIGDRFSFKLPLCGLLLAWSSLLFALPSLNLAYGILLKILFTIWVGLLFFCMSGVFVFAPVACSTLFGKQFLAVNFGLIYSAFIIGSIFAAVFAHIPSIAGNFTYQFYLSGTACIIALIASIWLKDKYSPKCCNRLDVFNALRNTRCECLRKA